MIRPFPRLWLNGCHPAGSGGPRGPRHGVFPPGQRSFTPSAVYPSCLHRFCCRVAVDRPRVPLPVAMTLGHLTRSGGESEIVRLGVSVGAPFKESGPLRSHVTTTAIGVETDQPRGRWPAGHHVRISGARLSSCPDSSRPGVGSGCFIRSTRVPPACDTLFQATGVREPHRADRSARLRRSTTNGLPPTRSSPPLTSPRSSSGPRVARSSSPTDARSSMLVGEPLPSTSATDAPRWPMLWPKPPVGCRT